MPDRPFLLLAALGISLLVALPGCGDEGGSAGPTPAEEPGSGAPAEPGRTTTGALLEALAARVGDGRGISDATWTRDVQEVGMALWPEDASGAHLAARRDHTNLTHIAGDMAGRLAESESAREEWLASDPLSVRVYDAFLAASRRGADAYRAWVVGGGRALLEERFEALQGERPPR